MPITGTATTATAGESATGTAAADAVSITGRHPPGQPARSAQQRRMRVPSPEPRPAPRQEPAQRGRRQAMRFRSPALPRPDPRSPPTTRSASPPRTPCRSRAHPPPRPPAHSAQHGGGRCAITGTAATATAGQATCWHGNRRRRTCERLERNVNRRPERDRHRVRIGHPVTGVVAAAFDGEALEPVTPGWETPQTLTATWGTPDAVTALWGDPDAPTATWDDPLIIIGGWATVAGLVTAGWED